MAATQIAYDERQLVPQPRAISHNTCLNSAGHATSIEHESEPADARCPAKRLPIAGLRHAPPGDDHFSPVTGRRPAPIAGSSLLTHAPLNEWLMTHQSPLVWP